jgi:hypothetical protein
MHIGHALATRWFSHFSPALFSFGELQSAESSRGWSVGVADNLTYSGRNSLFLDCKDLQSQASAPEISPQNRLYFVSGSKENAGKPSFQGPNPLGLKDSGQSR